MPRKTETRQNQINTDQLMLQMFCLTGKVQQLEHEMKSLHRKDLYPLSLSTNGFYQVGYAPNFRVIFNQGNYSQTENFDIDSIVRYNESPEQISSKLKLDFTLTLKSNNIKIINSDKIFNYLNKFPDLFEPLKKITTKARELLGSDTILALTLYEDPEFQDNYLTLYFRNEERETMLLDKIEELKQYVNDETINTEGYLLINKDYTTATLKE